MSALSETIATLYTATSPDTYQSGDQIPGNRGGTDIAITLGTAAALATSAVCQTANNLSDVSTKSTALTNIGGVSGSFYNVLRNGTFDIWQRGTSSLTATTSGSYTADGWIVTPTGASVTCAQASNNRTGANTLYGLQVTGASGVTDLTTTQRIESYIAAQLAAQVVTVSMQIYNNTGSSLTPKLSTKYPTAQDNWASSTADLAATNLQTCANGAWTQIYYTFTPSASATAGYEIILDFGNNFTAGTKTLIIAEADLRLTPGLTTAQANVPTYRAEIRPLPVEIALCQRYFVSFGGLTGPVGSGAATSTTASGYIIDLPVPMRVNPTGIGITTVGDFEVATMAAADTAALTGMTFSKASTGMLFVTTTVASGLTSGTSYILYAKTALAANLTVNGAEL